MTDQIAPERGADSAASQPMSIADEIRATHEALSAEREPKLFELPGFGPKLQAKYKVLSYDEQKEQGEKIAGELQAEKFPRSDVLVIGMSDMLIGACIGFYTEVDRKPVPLEETDPEYEGGPIRWGDQRLARLCRLAADGDQLTARQILRGVLVDPSLIVEHGEDVSRWMERERRKTEVDF
jgi:hypothetical protein